MKKISGKIFVFESKQQHREANTHSYYIKSNNNALLS